MPSATTQSANSSRRQKIKSHVQELDAAFIPEKNKPIAHEKIFEQILKELPKIEFKKHWKLDDKERVSQRHYYVATVDQVVAAAKKLQCDLAKRYSFLYAFNGQFWQRVEEDELKRVLGAAAKKLGVEGSIAADYKFRDSLIRQFYATAYLPEPKRAQGVTLVNLSNGTFEITKDSQRLRAFRAADFLTYALAFDYDPKAEYPKWQGFLDEMLPDKECQNLLAEFFGYIFTQDLKLEAALILYGGGGNGKSVVFDTMNALLGVENISTYSLQSLADEKGYHRAMLPNKLLNYSSEVSSKLEIEAFKKLVSGEPIEARLPGQPPFELRNYCKFAFNGNELPRTVEHNEAYFRRWVIIPFAVHKLKLQQDKDLAKKIIADELPGVFNWILEGLKRILKQRDFSPCKASDAAREAYRTEADTLGQYLSEYGIRPVLGEDSREALQLLYTNYREFARDCGYVPLGRANFSRRLQGKGFRLKRRNHGTDVFLERGIEPEKSTEQEGV